MPSTSHELLPIVVQGNNQLVDASLLHKRVKTNTRFNDWINYRIREYGFEKDRDYFTEKVSNQAGAHGGNRRAINYFLTLDMAKELAMLEKNETGRAIRRYFIAKEKELRGISQLPGEPALFRGLKGQNINGRPMYIYQAIRGRIGFSTRSSSSYHRQRYPGHFVLNGRTLLVTKEFALHLLHQRQVINNRIVLREMQPVLPFDFGSPIHHS